jgi:hypothetical protein
VKAVLLVTVMLVLLTACVITPDGIETIISVRYEPPFPARVMFLEADYETERTPLPVESIFLSFPFIGGDLLGAVTSADYIRPSIDEDYTFWVDLNASRFDLLHSIRKASFRDEGLRIEPGNTKIARVATFTYVRRTKKRAGYTGWLDASTNEVLVLVYFDRECVLSGQVFDNGHEVLYDVRVPHDGYHWLRFKEVDEERTELVRSERPSELLLFVLPIEGPLPR